MSFVLTMPNEQGLISQPYVQTRRACCVNANPQRLIFRGSWRASILQLAFDFVPCSGPKGLDRFQHPTADIQTILRTGVEYNGGFGTFLGDFETPYLFFKASRRAQFLRKLLF